jgi:hypothetical protein
LLFRAPHQEKRRKGQMTSRIMTQTGQTSR